MDNQVRELLRGIAEDIPHQREVPPTLRRRARRRMAATVGVTAVLVGALALGGVVAVRSITTTSPQPVRPGPTPIGAGEVLTVIEGSDAMLPRSERNGPDLVAQDPDSGGIRTIVSGGLRIEGTPKGIVGAAWSPDHRWVAFRAGGLWVSDTNGGDPRQLTPDQGWFPWAWSPFGDQLAVVQGRDVTLVDAASGHKTDLGTTVSVEDGDGVAVHALVWSPDGTRLAYDGGSGGGTVYSIDVASGKHSVLVRQPAGAGRIKDIDWSPDGAHLAISYGDAAYITSHVYLADADGSHLRLLDRIVMSQWPVWNPGRNVSTAWSPDGTRLAYASEAGAGHHDLQVWTVPMDGSAPSLIASPCCLDPLEAPVWSPDGSQIAVETLPDVGRRFDPGYLVVDADGTSEPRQIDELTYRSLGGGWFFCFCYG